MTGAQREFRARFEKAERELREAEERLAACPVFKGKTKMPPEWRGVRARLLSRLGHAERRLAALMPTGRSEGGRAL